MQWDFPSCSSHLPTPSLHIYPNLWSRSVAVWSWERDGFSSSSRWHSPSEGDTMGFRIRNKGNCRASQQLACADCQEIYDPIGSGTQHFQQASRFSRHPWVTYTHTYIYTLLRGKGSQNAASKGLPRSPCTFLTSSFQLTLYLTLPDSLGAQI